MKNDNKNNKKKKKSIGKTLLGIGIFCVIMVLFVAMGLVGINLYVRMSVKNRLIREDKASEMNDVDAILVLGASVVNGDTPSPMLKDRLDKAIELYFAGCAPKIIMSGDHGGEYYNEVKVMKEYAISKGVPAEDIFMDHAGFSTYESMYRAKEIFGVKKMVVVTQSYHLYRAVYVANRLGVDAYGVAAANTRYSGQSVRDVREYLAVFKDFFQAIVKPKPTLLGNPIDITGDGNVTNDGD